MENKKAISLHVGLNSVDPDHYHGVQELKSCEFDAKDMKSIAESLNYDESNILLTAEANRENVISLIKKAAEGLDSGDLFLLTYSGHGGQLPDKNNDEKSGLDDTWILYDAVLIDDELYSLWKEFKEGVRVFVLSDSCHSGTVIKVAGPDKAKPAVMQKDFRYKYVSREIMKDTYLRNKEFYDDILKKIDRKKSSSDVLASVRLISACQDNETAIDNPSHGLFTAALLSIWDDGNFSGNYREFYDKICEKTSPVQNPNFYFTGIPNDEFDNQKPFSK